MRLMILTTANLRAFDREALRLLFECESIQVVGVCIDTRPAPTAWRRIRSEWKKGRGGYVLVMIVNKLLSRFSTSELTDTSTFLASRGVTIHYSPKVTADDTLKFIRDARPDVIFCGGFGLIREPILSIAPKGVLSYHHGNIRKYRGQPVAFWELYHGETEMGVTVQVLNEILDGGKIAKEITVPVRPTDSWATLYDRAYAASPTMIRDACLALQTPGFSPLEIPRDELGPLFTTPNLRQWLTLQVRVIGRKLRAWMNPEWARSIA